MQTLDNLLMRQDGLIDYLERVPNGYKSKQTNDCEAETEQVPNPSDEHPGRECPPPA
jgi:hypothetical protein